ncbi:MAG: hypothetical protein ACI9G1_002139 [Pirellulaceae bacterium]|jgi:hypothetical protein
MPLGWELKLKWRGQCVPHTIHRELRFLASLSCEIGVLVFQTVLHSRKTGITERLAKIFVVGGICLQTTSQNAHLEDGKVYVFV